MYTNALVIFFKVNNIRFLYNDNTTARFARFGGMLSQENFE